MHQGVVEYVNKLFKSNPALADSPEFKAEFINVINTRIDEYISKGLDYQSAFEAAVSKFESDAPYTGLPEATASSSEKSGALYFDLNHLSGALWLIVVAFYVLFSFVTKSWAWSWTIFLAMSAFQTLISDYHKHKRITRDGFTGAFWICVTAFYFIFSFVTRAWAWSWVIFILGAAFTTLLYGVKRH